MWIKWIKWIICGLIHENGFLLLCGLSGLSGLSVDYLWINPRKWISFAMWTISFEVFEKNLGNSRFYKKLGGFGVL